MIQVCSDRPPCANVHCSQLRADDTDEPPEDAPEEQEAPPKEPAKSVSSPSSGGMSAAGKSKLEMLRKR